MSQNTNTVTVRSDKQLELLSDDKAKLVAAMADGLDLHSPGAQSELRKRLTEDSKISDIELTAWLVEFGGVRLLDIAGSIKLSSRDTLTGVISDDQKRANMRIGIVNASNRA